jgi:hypothetical protein
MNISQRPTSPPGPLAVHVMVLAVRVASSMITGRLALEAALTASTSALVRSAKSSAEDACRMSAPSAQRV